jgi:hypothetical protein
MRNAMRMGMISAWYFGLSLTVSSCGVFINEDPDDDWEESQRYEYRTSFKKTEGSSSSVSEVSCTEHRQQRNYEKNYERYCYEKEESFIDTTCQGDACNQVKVNVFYLLNEDLGSSQTVIVEAFDNPYFAGSPEASAILDGFDASRAGRRSTAEIFLPDGTFYFRAFISHRQDEVTPYEYNGMSLVTEKPMGTYGALSELRSLVLNNEEESNHSVDIFLDKLFKGPDAESQAFLRLLVSLPEGFQAPLGRQVRIELHTQDDFAFLPAQVYSIPSESFLIAGLEGRAEFLSPQVPIGKYFIRSYLDSNSNGFWDDGELYRVLKKYDEPAWVEIKSLRTATVELALVAVTP